MVLYIPKIVCWDLNCRSRAGYEKLVHPLLKETPYIVDDNLFLCSMPMKTNERCNYREICLFDVFCAMFIMGPRIMRSTLKA